MQRLISLSVVLVLASVTLGQWKVSAVGDGVVVTGPDGRETRLAVAPAEVRQATVTKPAPVDWHDSFAAWDPWPGGKGKTVLITPARDEVNTHILGGLYRSVQAETVHVSAGGKTFKPDEDYKYNPDWAQIAGINGRLGTGELTISYTYALQRLDLVQVDSAGKVTVKRGESKLVCPPLPSADAGATPIAGIYIAPWRREGKYVVTQEDIYPIRPSEPAPNVPADLPNTRKLLQSGGELRIAFLGDSVVLGAEAGAWWMNLWTEKNTAFVSRVVVALRKRYPDLTITPIHAAKGATTTKAAAGFFEEQIVPQRANLVVIGYGLNDAHGPVAGPPANPPASYKEDIRAIVTRAKAMGAEVILITPFQPNPFLKNGIGRRITAYRDALIELAREERVAVADVYTAWMQQADRGVPPFSQLHNWNNHPGPEGHALYADTILKLLIDSPAVVRSSTTQPADIPGDWEYKPAPLPDLKAVLQNARPNPHIYGLYTWGGEYLAHRKSIRQVGWKAIRAGGPLEDAHMTAYAEDGMEVMLNVGAGRLGREFKTADELIAAYPGKLEGLITRFGPGGTFFRDHPGVPNRPIVHYEITNEPNFQYVIPPDGRPPKELEAAREALYAKLLPEAYKVKQKHPGISIVGFSAGGASAGDLRFVKNVYALNRQVHEAYDQFATHPYVRPAPPEGYSRRSWGSYSIASSLATLRETIQDKPVWYTEIGWPISKADGGRFETGNEPMVSPMLQAAYVVRLYAYAQRLGVERVHIMFTTDTDNFNGGFFLRDGAWRPSARAVATMIKVLPNPRLVEVLRDGDDGVFVYRFDTDGRDVVMAWTVKGTRTLDVQVRGKRAVVTDMLGQSTEVRDEGRATIEIGPLPMYVAGE